MTDAGWWLPALAFGLGVGATAAAWWVWSWVGDRSSPSPVAPASIADDPPGSVQTATVSAEKPAAGRGSLRTSQRVVLHLSRQPRLTYGDVAPTGVTQAGISQALSIAQPALARVLARLRDGEAILEMRTHVSGQPRRLKVYQLTVHGEAIARDLRRQLHGSAPDAAEGRRVGSEAQRTPVAETRAEA